MALPSSLHSLTFGWCSNQSLEEVVLPSILQSLIFDRCFNQSLRRRSEPANSPELYTWRWFQPKPRKAGLCAQSSKPDICFNQSLEGETLPNALQSLTFGDDFNQTLKQVTLPCHAVFKAWHLAAITIGAWAEWPCQAVLRAWGSEVSLTSNKSLDGVALPSSLQSLTFGLSFEQTLKQAALPSSLQSLTFG